VAAAVLRKSGIWRKGEEQDSDEKDKSPMKGEFGHLSPLDPLAAETSDRAVSDCGQSTPLDALWRGLVA
jgi:hypothetical protein